MSEVTIELVQAKQAELAAMIELLQRQAQPLRVPAADILLAPGEWYAGAVLNEDGSLKHHIIVGATQDSGLNFDHAQAFAKARGLYAPTIQEARLIVAHRHGRLDGMSWFWTCEPHKENSAFAWDCYLDDGGVNYCGRSASGGAVAVRRVNS